MAKLYSFCRISPDRLDELIAKGDVLRKATECPICTEEFVDCESITVTLCRHTFCSDCYMQLLKAADKIDRCKCPICDKLLNGKDQNHRAMNRAMNNFFNFL